MTNLNTPKQMYLDKKETIKKYVDEKDINIRISWAINNAVQMTIDNNNDISDEILETSIKEWTDWFLDYFKEKKQEVLEEEVEKMGLKAEQQAEQELNFGLELQEEQDRSDKLKKANSALRLK